MEKNKYVPPNIRKTIKKTVQLDTNNEEHFPSLSASVVVKNKEWGTNKINEEETMDEFQLELKNALKNKWMPMNIENNSENEDEEYTYDEKELFSVKFANVINRLGFEKMLKAYVECPYKKSYGRFIDWFEALFHDIIIPDLTSQGYMFTHNIIKIKSKILHWIYAIDKMGPTAVSVNFPINLWIVPNKKLRRERDLERFLEIFPTEYWEGIYEQYRLESHWMFNRDNNRGKLICDDLPFYMYSLLDLSISSQTEIIDAEIAEEEEAEAYSIIFNSRYRNNLENADELNDILRRTDTVNREELRGDRKHDLW
jgi:hypothetical protein